MAKAEKNKRDTQKETIRKVWQYLKAYRFYIIVSLVLAAVVVALQLYIPILTGRAIDCILSKGNVDFDGIFAVLRTMGVVILITEIGRAHV